jgi:predicted ATPase/DNA-binding winged helix-turn-helix (wHTH) protein
VRQEVPAVVRHYRFDRFELDLAQRLLLSGDQVVPLGSRASELLFALVEGHGRLLTKQVLLDRVWPDLNIEENNLATQVSLLRRVLGADAIITVPALGYRFGWPVDEVMAETARPNPAGSAGGARTTFGNFEWRAGERRLFCHGVALDLGARALDVLALLVEQRHRAVSKQELLDCVWRGLVVDENNLQVQVSALRKALGPEAISTLPGIGYRFTLVRTDQDTAEFQTTETRRQDAERRSNLAVVAEALIGRVADVEALKQLTGIHRLVTIVGAGGIGKTSLADAAARALISAYPDGVWWVDLAEVDSNQKIVAAVATAAGAQLAEGDSTAQLVLSLKARQLLLVLDNCEHLQAGVAVLMQTLLSASRALHVLATSRQPLKVPGEQVYRVDPLTIPPPGTSLANAREYGAIELLHLRASAADRLFCLNAANIDAAIDLCRQLDGVALAIEMVASRVPSIGLAALSAGLGQSLRLLKSTGRGVSQRHRTLETTLDWSYSLLSEHEKSVLCSLSVFAGSFSLDVARGVGSEAHIDEWAVLDALSNLVDCSLIQVEQRDPPRYRLLETTRLYARQQLADSGQGVSAERRHALAMADLANTVNDNYWCLPDADWLGRHALDYPDLELAFERACRLHDAEVGAATLDALFQIDHLRLAFGRIGEHLKLSAQLLESASGAALARLQTRLSFFFVGALAGVDRARCAQEASLTFRAMGDKPREYEAILHLVMVHAARGDFDAAAKAEGESRFIEDPQWPPRLRYFGAMMRSQLRAFQGEVLAYRSAIHEQLALAEQAGSPRQVAVSRCELANAALLAEDWAEAAGLAREVIEELRELNSPAAQAMPMINLVIAELRSGNPETARVVAEEALPLAVQNGMLGILSAHLALLAASFGQCQKAAQLVGYVDAWYARTQRLLEPAERRSTQIAQHMCDVAMGGASLAKAISDGGRLHDAQAAVLISAVLAAAKCSIGSPSLSFKT